MSVFHEGEREVQRRVGVAATARELGQGIGPIIPPGARPFLEGQRIAVLAGLDGTGRVWTSLLAKDPRVGLLFVDFASGTTQQLSGRARILWDSASFSDLPGAERAVDIEVDLVVELERRVAGGFRLIAPSPFNP